MIRKHLGLLVFSLLALGSGCKAPDFGQRVCPVTLTTRAQLESPGAPGMEATAYAVDPETWSKLRGEERFDGIARASVSGSASAQQLDDLLRDFLAEIEPYNVGKTPVLVKLPCRQYVYVAVRDGVLRRLEFDSVKEKGHQVSVDLR